MKNIFYYCAGLSILILNKLRYSLTGYRTPRPFPTEDVEKAIAYDKEIIAGWSSHLKKYSGLNQPFSGRTILELGPGGDIGVAAMLIDEGAKSYYALDKFPLWQSMPDSIFDQLHKKLRSERARRAIADYRRGNESDIHYNVSDSVKKSSIPKTVDLIVSQAAFEHFENTQTMLSEISELVQHGTVLCAEIDMQTHTRWIREADPNNIYRFPQWLYRLLRYPGIPNRLRSNDYRMILENNGWKNITIIPLRSLGGEQKHSLRGLNHAFDSADDLEVLSIMLLATLK